MPASTPGPEVTLWKHPPLPWQALGRAVEWGDELPEQLAKPTSPQTWASCHPVLILKSGQPALL